VSIHVVSVGKDVRFQRDNGMGDFAVEGGLKNCFPKQNSLRYVQEASKATNQQPLADHTQGACSVEPLVVHYRQPKGQICA
jgi:hypothetical protein